MGSWDQKPVMEGIVDTGETSVLCRCGLAQPLEQVNLQAVSPVLGLPMAVPLKILGSTEYQMEWRVVVLVFSE
jgi:hypothetical protein